MIIIDHDDDDDDHVATIPPWEADPQDCPGRFGESHRQYIGPYWLKIPLREYQVPNHILGFCLISLCCLSVITVVPHLTTWPPEKNW